MKQQTKILLIVAGCVAAAATLTQAKHVYKKPVEENEELEEIVYEPSYLHHGYGFLSEESPSNEEGGHRKGHKK